LRSRRLQTVSFSSARLLPRRWRRVLAPIVPALDRALSLHRLQALYDEASDCGNHDGVLGRALRLVAPRNPYRSPLVSAPDGLDQLSKLVADL